MGVLGAVWLTPERPEDEQQRQQKQAASFEAITSLVAINQGLICLDTRVYLARISPGEPSLRQRESCRVLAIAQAAFSLLKKHRRSWFMQ